MTTKISTDNIQPNTVVSYAEYSTGVIPKITTVNVANSSYALLDDTAVNIGGGYIVITGRNFESTSQVLIDVTPATSTTYVNTTTLRAQVPTKSAATYNIHVVNQDGGTGTRINGITYSGTPTWVTASALANVLTNTAFTGSFSATGASSYAVAAGSSLPTGMTLVTANGYYYGNISVSSITTYSFTINANDAENQESSRTFSLTTVVSNAPTTVEYLVVAGGGAGFIDDGNGGLGGGGGAGGLIHSNTAITTGTSYTITVGSGGGYRANGANSEFAGAIAFGGGKGGSSPSHAAAGGGSGGGSGNGYAYGRGVYPGSPFISATRQGYDGAQGATPQYSGGGGGGAGGDGRGNGGGPGGNYALVYYDTSPFGLAGGPGKTDAQLNGILSATSSGALAGAPLNPSYNNTTYIAGGGAGGGDPYNYAGGFGGGGWGLSVPYNSAAKNGFTNTGGGGGGGSYGFPSVSSGSGGSGVVIIRYPSSFDVATSTTGSPTVTTSGDYRYYKFTGSGSITW